MTERYAPPSDFLNAIAANKAPLSGSEFGAANLRMLIAMTRDENLVNRDWAVFLLAQQNIDTPPVREALLGAASDDEQIVRAEAIWGLARRDRKLALPLVQRELSEGWVSVPILEAAGEVSDPSLVDRLRALAESSDQWIADAALDALAACENAASVK